MKILSSLLMTSLLVAGCAPGGGKKNPVGSDLKTIRQEGKRLNEMGPVTPTYVEKEKVRTVEKEKIVYLSEPSANDLVIEPDEQMDFSEGKSSTFKINVRSLIPGVTIDLSAANLPKSATLTPSKEEKSTYNLSWKPEYNDAKGQRRYVIKTTLTLKVIGVDAKVAQPEKVRSLVNQKNIYLNVFPSDEGPSDVQISGLPAEVVEGSQTPFTVTVNVPGLNANAPVSQQPTLKVTYDGIGFTEGNAYSELDGSRHVLGSGVEFKNGAWVFTRTFDTLKVTPQPQLDKNGKVLAGADGTHVRMTIKVYANNSSTPAVVKQVKIKSTKKVSVPQFDMSGLKNSTLQVSRGSQVQLKFTAASAAETSQLSVVGESTLVGAPTVTCQPSARGPNQLNCLMAWNVPCEAQVKELTGTVTLVATDAAADAGSNSSTFVIKTKAAAKEDKKLCGNGKK